MARREMMRLAAFIAVLVGCGTRAAAASTALETPIKLPLRWLNRRAYVARAVVNGVSVDLQVATTTSDVWLACSSVISSSSFAETCRARACPAILTHDGVNTCTSQATASLSLANGALALEDFPVDVVFDNRNASTVANGSSGGVLGLGLRSAVFGSMYPEMLSHGTLIETVQNFSLYLTDAPGGNGSYVQLGGSFPDQLDGFDSQELSARGLATRFSLPLRLHKTVGLNGWDLSVTAVRFGGDQLLYPRVYSSSEVAGSDAVASVSVSDSVVKMPPSVFKHFREKYLGTDCVLRADGSDGYSCDPSTVALLPRIAIYVGDKVFYLTSSDYAVQTSTQVLVLVAPSSSETQWVLGAPFLRKFPSMFSLPARCVDVLCEFSVSCDSTPLGDAWGRQYLPLSSSNGVSNSSTPIEEGGGFVTTAAPLPPGKKVIIWMSFSFGVIGCCLAAISAVNRWRHRNDPDLHGNGTVASDKDLEELELALRELSTTASEARQQSNFTPLPSPASRNDQRV